MTIKEKKILFLLAARQAVSETIINGKSHFVINNNIYGQHHSIKYLHVYDYLTELIIQMEEDIE